MQYTEQQLEYLKFFSDHEIFKDSRIVYVRVKDIFEQNQMQIERAKIYGDSSLYQQQSFDLFLEMRRTFDREEPLEFMKAICKSQEILDELEQMENKDKLQITINELQKNIAFMIEFTMQQPQFFFKFAYEIRKHDSIL